MPEARKMTGRRKSIADRLTGPADAVFAGNRADYRFHYLELDSVQPNPRNARRHYDEVSLQGLAASIRQLGVIQPISVKRVKDGLYEIIAGERRYRASRMAQKDRIPAVIIEHGNHNAMALVENLQREDLNPMEEALGIQHLIETEQLTQSAAGEMIGRSEAYVSLMLGLLSLEEEVKQAVLEGERASKSQLQELLGLEPQQQLKLWRMIQAGATIKDLREAKADRPKKPRGRVSYFEQVERRLQRITRTASNQSGEERMQLTEELERLKRAIDTTLDELRTS